MLQRHIDEIDFQRAILISLILPYAYVPPCHGLSFEYGQNLSQVHHLSAEDSVALRYLGYRIYGIVTLSACKGRHSAIGLAHGILCFCIHSIGPYCFFRVMLICGFLCNVTFRCLYRQPTVHLRKALNLWHCLIVCLVLHTNHELGTSVLLFSWSGLTDFKG